MIFSTPVFLFFFLPVFYAVYALTGFRNVVLLIASLLFYYWGEAAFTALLIGSIAFNYFFGIILSKARKNGGNLNLWLSLGIGANLAFLILFKYANFVVDNINVLLSGLDIGLLAHPNIHLPLGISFFTFQAMSYLIDVKRGDIEVERGYSTLALYIALFPQLVAGPIVRYREIAGKLHDRRVAFSDFSVGVERFIIGLIKKVVFADQIGPVADAIFAAHGTDLSSPVAWLGVLCFTLQIYFDFSGYSDMAIGLGRMLGFKFPENFMHPYKSRSIQEFWRRWHMTLSRFFRDYLYIPLGGSRKGKWRTFANLWIVFVLCGLWHGASWAFVIWGVWHGLFLIFERTWFGKLVDKSPIIIKHAYVIIVVMIGWIFFRSESLQMATNMIYALGAHGWFDYRSIFEYVNFYQLFIIALGSVMTFPVRTYLHNLTAKYVERIGGDNTTTSQPLVSHNKVIRTNYALAASWSTAYLVGLLWALAVLTSSTHQAFIYFRF